MKITLFALAGIAAFAAALAMPAIARDPERATSLFEFDSASGYVPGGGVIADRHGTVFGTTDIGGTGPCTGGAGCGTVFALSPPAGGGSWLLHKLYDFQGGQDGSSPCAQLTLGPNGVLYGYATGGTFGTVFRLSPPRTAGKPWGFKILYVFSGGADGHLLSVCSPLVLRRGALYGIASGGATACGQFGCGSVFRLTPGSGRGAWTEKTLFSFTGGADSGQPTSMVGFGDGIVLDVSTSRGNGAVVELTPAPSAGEWIEKVITRFHGATDGQRPTNLVLAPDGTLYGLANGSRDGLVFQLTPPAAGGTDWTRTTIAAINDHNWGPVSLAAGANGSLIGAVEGDFDFFAGSVFQLTPPAVGGDPWTYTQLWDFNRGPDRNPLNVVSGRLGNLFVVLEGGDSSSGSLVKLH